MKDDMGFVKKFKMVKFRQYVNQSSTVSELQMFFLPLDLSASLQPFSFLLLDSCTMCIVSMFNVQSLASFPVF